MNTCEESVWEPGGFHAYPCGKRGKVERDGHWYCGIHAPVARAEKQAARDKAWQDRWAASWASRAAARQQQGVIERIVRAVACTDPPYCPEEGTCSCAFCEEVGGHEPDCIVVAARSIVGEWDSATSPTP